MDLEYCYNLSSVNENAFTCRVKVAKFATMLFIIVLVIFIPISFFLFSVFFSVSSLLLVLEVRLKGCSMCSTCWNESVDGPNPIT